ncbi:MAG: type II secretion system F family protein [bacterium]
MPNFEFIAKDLHGKNFRGTLFSQTEQGVYFALEKLGYLVLTVHERENIFAYQLPQRITAADVTLLTKLLATLMEAGMPVVDALVTLETQTENITFSKIIRNIRINVENGMSLSDAFAKHPKIFPPFYISMIRSGETAGIMPEIYNHLSGYLDKSDELRQRVATAFTYPKIIATIALAGSLILMYYVIPQFNIIYTKLGIELNTSTKFLIGASDFAKNYWWVICLAIAALIYGFYKFRTSKQTARYYHPLVLAIPILGKINKRVSVTRTARTLSSMLQCGVPMITALETSKTVANNKVIEEDIDRVIESVQAGGTISGPLKVSPNFPPLVISMIASGERSGTLPHLLGKAADALDRELEHLIKRFLYYLEPALTLIIAISIGFIAFSIYVPIFNLIGGFKPSI